MEATIAGQAWAKAFGAAMGVIGGCFARREARETARELTAGLLLEVHTRNCWTLAEALGHPGPHRLQHLLSRARFDHDQAREQVARMVIDHLADEDVVLVVDETGTPSPRLAVWARAGSIPVPCTVWVCARSRCIWPWSHRPHG